MKRLTIMALMIILAVISISSRPVLASTINVERFYLTVDVLLLLKLGIRNTGQQAVAISRPMVSCRYRCADNMGSGGTNMITGVLRLDPGEFGYFDLAMPNLNPCHPVSYAQVTCDIGPTHISEFLRIP